LEDIDAIDKEKLIYIKDKIYDVSNSLNETFDIKTYLNKDSANIIFLTENPDPVEISIVFKKDIYRVTYWDGYGVTEFYDYDNLNKGLKKFLKFVDKAKSNIEKFGLK
tara:strand:- start:3695 stop:4018 length:324 start_codon:yes stop_codon:yes gene_type:complete